MFLVFGYKLSSLLPQLVPLSKVQYKLYFKSSLLLNSFTISSKTIVYPVTLFSPVYASLLTSVHK